MKRFLMIFLVGMTMISCKEKLTVKMDGAKEKVVFTSLESESDTSHWYYVEMYDEEGEAFAGQRILRKEELDKAGMEAIGTEQITQYQINRSGAKFTNASENGTVFQLILAELNGSQVFNLYENREGKVNRLAYHQKATLKDSVTVEDFARGLLTNVVKYEDSKKEYFDEEYPDYKVIYYPVADEENTYQFTIVSDDKVVAGNRFTTLDPVAKAKAFLDVSFK